MLIDILLGTPMGDTGAWNMSGGFPGWGLGEW
jgi:hypothetical protein